MTSSVRLFSAIASVLLAGVGLLTAQVDTGVLSGYVYDDSGAVIPGCAVTVRNVGTNYEFDLETNAAGLFVSPPLPPGTYRLTVLQEGFATAAKEVSLHLSERLALDFTLQIGSVAETVTVEAVGEVLQTENTTLSTLRTEREVKELPVNSRNFAELLRFSSGVVPGQSQAGGLPLSQARGNTTSSVNGNDIGDNNFSIDGSEQQQPPRPGNHEFHRSGGDRPLPGRDFGSGRPLRPLWRDDQRGIQVRNQRIPRRAVPFPAQRQARCPQLLRSRRQGASQAQLLWRHLWRARRREPSPDVLLSLVRRPAEPAGHHAPVHRADAQHEER